ncbi:phosphotransferase family protein [Paractinoplanes lichenicola]|uniref:Aminoglycoside phosphotransferase family protein n=1 Tax=Paractinoplanes lichenicola TaxID=2802976 RepID=A0ABS1VTJ8_9ACTN|nr:phosphotransferase [Actinoplanes lichenicola]MBL7257797.1 aminoglycoside phosphotransferase family protein [Actinoplanes lichenicola]
MEGIVHAIDHQRVAKKWHHARRPELERLARFYDELGTKDFTFAVPAILDITEEDGKYVTVERRLHGTPGVAGPDTMVDIVAELADSGPLPFARTLAVPFSPGEDFPDALGRLATDRVTPVLHAAVENLDGKVEALRRRLHEVDTGRRAVIHGDLIAGNVLGRAVAVLDWGFLTTEGDPAFEAAITAAIFDMYGPAALDTELELLARMETRLGYDHTTLLVYRAAYSIFTATAYDPTGRDGHFAWCAAALNRDDVTQALLF